MDSEPSGVGKGQTDIRTDIETDTCTDRQGENIMPPPRGIKNHK